MGRFVLYSCVCAQHYCCISHTDGPPARVTASRRSLLAYPYSPAPPPLWRMSRGGATSKYVWTCFTWGWYGIRQHPHPPARHAEGFSGLIRVFVRCVLGCVATSLDGPWTIHPPPNDLWGTVRSATAHLRSNNLRQRSGLIVTFSVEAASADPLPPPLSEWFACGAAHPRSVAGAQTRPTPICSPPSS